MAEKTPTENPDDTETEVLKMPIQATSDHPPGARSRVLGDRKDGSVWYVGSTTPEQEVQLKLTSQEEHGPNSQKEALLPTDLPPPCPGPANALYRDGYLTPIFVPDGQKGRLKNRKNEEAPGGPEKEESLVDEVFETLQLSASETSSNSDSSGSFEIAEGD